MVITSVEIRSDVTIDLDLHEKVEKSSKKQIKKSTRKIIVHEIFGHQKIIIKNVQFSGNFEN